RWHRTHGSMCRPPTKSFSTRPPKSATTQRWPTWASPVQSCFPVNRDMPDAERHETLIAFDYGLKKIGVAIGNTLTRHARPLQVLRPVTREERFRAIAGVLSA